MALAVKTFRVNANHGESRLINITILLYALVTVTVGIVQTAFVLLINADADADGDNSHFSKAEISEFIFSMGKLLSAGIILFSFMLPRVLAAREEQRQAAGGAIAPKSRPSCCRSFIGCLCFAFPVLQDEEPDAPTFARYHGAADELPVVDVAVEQRDEGQRASSGGGRRSARMRTAVSRHYSVRQAGDDYTHMSADDLRRCTVTSNYSASRPESSRTETTTTGIDHVFSTS